MMLEVGSRVRVSRTHWLAAGAKGRIIAIEYSRPSGEVRFCSYHVELDAETRAGVRQLWFSPRDVIAEPGE